MAPHALTALGVYVDRNIVREQQVLQQLLEAPASDELPARITDFAEFCTALLGWEPTDLLGAEASQGLMMRPRCVLTRLVVACDHARDFRNSAAPNPQP